MAETVQVLLWTAVRIYRDGLCAALDSDPRIDGVLTVADAAECRHALHALRPDVLVLDGHDEDALAVARCAREMPTGVVALGASEIEREVLAFAEAGVSAYVTCEQALSGLIDSIVAVACGEVRCTPKIAGILLRHIASVGGRPERAETRHVRLTRREAEILALVTEGLSNKQIALQLSIELPTVKNHVHNVLEKLGVRTRSQAVAVTSGVRPRVAI